MPTLLPSRVTIGEPKMMYIKVLGKINESVIILYLFFTLNREKSHDRYDLSVTKCYLIYCNLNIHIEYFTLKYLVNHCYMNYETTIFMLKFFL